MDSVDILINEHVYIKKVLVAIKRDCEQLVEGKDVDVNFYRKVIDFVRNFADKYHHQKEENMLFNIMAEKNEALKTGVIQGMLLEHDLGRMYIRNLEDALNKYENGDKKQKAYIVANAISYALLLEGHIDKEDNAVYMTARKVLDKGTQEKLKEEYEKIERDEENTKIRNKYIEFANSL